MLSVVVDTYLYLLIPYFMLLYFVQLNDNDDDDDDDADDP